MNPAACGGSTVSSPSCPSSGATCTTFYSYYYNAANPVDPQNDELLTVRDGRSASASASTYETQYAYNTFGQLMDTTPLDPRLPGRAGDQVRLHRRHRAPAGGGMEPAGLLSAVTTPGGAKTSYTYDSGGDLAQVTRAVGPVHDVRVRRPRPGDGQHAVHLDVPVGGDDELHLHADRPAVGRHLPGGHEHRRHCDPPAGGYLRLRRRQRPVVDGAERRGRERPGRTTSYTYNDHDQVASATQPAGATSGGTAPDRRGGQRQAGRSHHRLRLRRLRQRHPGHGPEREPVPVLLQRVPGAGTGNAVPSSTNASASSATCTAPAVQDPDGGCDLVLESDAYDPAGLLAAQTDAMGRITNYAYDHDQELASRRPRRRARRLRRARRRDRAPPPRSARPGRSAR